MLKLTIIYFAFVIPGAPDLYSPGYISKPGACEDKAFMLNAKKSVMEQFMQANASAVPSVTEVLTFCNEIEHQDPDLEQDSI